MPQYTYNALNEDGTPLRGTIDAISIQAAQDALKGMNLQPEEIHEATLHDQNFISEEKSHLGNHPAWQVTSTADKYLETKSYYRIIETLRLYAGWLLAWYGLIYALGSYQHVRQLPFRIPYAQALFLSPLVLSFCFAAFLFLLLSTMHSIARKGKLIGFILYSLGIGVFVWYRMNVA